METTTAAATSYKPFPLLCVSSTRSILKWWITDEDPLPPPRPRAFSSTLSFLYVIDPQSIIAIEWLIESMQMCFLWLIAEEDPPQMKRLSYGCHM